MEDKEKEEIKEEKKESEKIEEVSEIKNETTKKKSSVGIILCFVIIAVLVVAIIGILLFRGGNHNNKETNKSSQDKTEYKSEYRMSGNSLEKFDLAFLKLENEEKNKIYSPLSIKYALAMLADGSNGGTREQITSVIGDYKSNQYPNNEHMSFANAMYIRDTFKEAVKDSYINGLKEKYNADVIVDPFTSAQPMNDWISNKTLRLINNLLDDQTVSQEQFLLINALAIDMRWNNQIHCAINDKGIPCMSYWAGYKHEKLKGEEREFHSNSSPYESEVDFPPITFDGKANKKSVEVLSNFNRYDIIKELGEEQIRKEIIDAYNEEVNNTGRIPFNKSAEEVASDFIEDLKQNYNKEKISTDYYFFVDDTVKVFAKDLQEYDGKSLQYVGIMPTNEKLKDYINHIEAEDVNQLIKNLKEPKYENMKDGVVTLIYGRIPLFQYDYKLDFMNDLKTLGIKDVFDAEAADLSNMVDTKGAFINYASHKATIDFSNDGITASAVTIGGGLGGASGWNYLFEVPYETIDLNFNKPYMYIIRDKATGEVWFTGTVYDPIDRPTTEVKSYARSEDAKW